MPAHAAPGEVLILNTTVSGGVGSLEATKVSLLGKTPVVVDAATWGSLTTAQFASYDAIILGDATCAGTADAAQANVGVWGPAIQGNVVIIGTDPEYHRGGGGDALTEKGIAFAVDKPGKTGAYITLSCYYHGTHAFTPVPLLSTLSSEGLFTVTGVGCYDDAHIVATHPALEGLTDANLSGWGCSVHEAFDSWPSDFQVLAIAENIGSWLAPDGTVGTPYILARGVRVLSDIDLTPLSSANRVGTSHTITATVAEGDPPTPVVGTLVTFTVVSGPHAGTTGNSTTDSSGIATFTYPGTTTGTDTIVAMFVDSKGRTQTSNEATKKWVEDCSNRIDDDGDGLVDCNDPECCDDPICFGIPPCTGFSETLLMQEAIMNDVEFVEVLGNLPTSTLDFTNFEIVTITTGPFAGKGFSKGTWETTLSSVAYTGEWKGVVFLNSRERRLYLKGAIFGEISATVEGYLTESVPDSGVYDKYQATWNIGRLGSTGVSASVNVNGNVSYQSSTEFPSTEFYFLQANFPDVTESGQYGGSLNTVLTHLRVISRDNPYVGEGFSIFSYNYKSGSGEGWTYDRLLSPGVVEMKGLFSSPLFGIVSATLDESVSPRTLTLSIERVDLNYPPMADLEVRTWGPERVSPGQTVTYTIEYRNDGLKSAENIALVYLPPYPIDFIWASPPGIYDDVIHIVRWDFSNIPPGTRAYLNIREKIFWGLPLGHQLIGEVHQFSQEEADSIFYGELHQFSKEETDSIFQRQSRSLTEIIKRLLDALWTGITTATDVPSVPSDLPEAARGIPVIRAYLEIINSSAQNFPYWEQVHALTSALQSGHSFVENGWATTDGQLTFPPGTPWDTIISKLKEHYKYTPMDAPNKNSRTITPARDPNIKYGPSGAVVAGQRLTYRVEFENEGEGIAFGVYFTDTLDEDLDASTRVIGEVKDVKTGLKIGEQGTYDPNTRTITWFVSGEGEIGPNVGGYAEISVNVGSDAPRGTEIINYGTVFFPSVPEETRTNAIVSRIPLIEDCSDGIDNDEDGLIDCDDPDCSGQDCVEVCDDEIDNDGDGWVDCADTDCPPCQEICDDGLDNDRDGLVDCDDPDCVCCDSANYGRGTSSITFKGGKKDSASLQMCVNSAFCDALRQNPKALSLRLDDCNEITIPGNKLRSDRSKTKFSARSSTYTLVIDCKKGTLSLRLMKVALKECVSNPVKMCVQIKDGLCLCAERSFVERRDRKGNLIGLSLRVKRVCTP